MSRLLLLVTLAGVLVAQGCRQEEKLPLPSAFVPDEIDQLDPEELLADMATFLAAHEDFGFDALVTYESLQESGRVLHFDLVQRVAVSRPDRLFWKTLYDDARVDTVWFSRGRFSMLKQPDAIYGQVDVPSRIRDMIDVVTNDYGMIVPFRDLFSVRDASPFLEDAKDVLYIGPAWVENRWSHHIAARNDLVDFEIWVQAEGDPVPLRIAITWKREEGRPSYVAHFRGWSFSPAFDDSQFRFDPPPDAEKIEILPLFVDRG